MSVEGEFNVNSLNNNLFIKKKDEKDENYIREIISKNYLIKDLIEDFDVESASSEKGFVKLLNKEKNDKRYMLEVEITPPAIEGNRRTFLDTFTVQLKDSEKIDVNVNGFYKRDKKKPATPRPIAKPVKKAETAKPE